MHRTALVLLVLLFAGCESDAEKLERLQSEAAFARMNRLRLEQELANPSSSRGLSRAALQDSLRAAETRATLAERELREFLNP